MNKNDTIYIAGASGLVGSALVRRLTHHGYNHIITDRVDLTKQNLVSSFFLVHEPKYVFVVAGTVGGIKANNTRKAEFIYNNLMIACNVINAAHRNRVTKLIYTGSSCIYPKDCPQPMKEEYLLSGELEKTNEPYAISKIAGIKLCQSYNFQYGSAFIPAMPTNSYGINDNYDLENSHVLPALIRKIITAKQNNSPAVEIWGTGNAKREFIYSEDMADAMIFLMNNYDSSEIINIGTGEEVTIRELAEIIKNVVGYEGEFIYTGDLEGTPRKLVDCSKINEMGWIPKISLFEGIKRTIFNLDKTKWK